jgi:outer membrane protein TolC
MAACALLVAGCAVAPVPFTQQERQQRIDADMQALFKDVEPLQGALTLHEAFARALKYNYDYRLRAMEQSLASGQLDAARYDMLPRLTASAGYSARSNDAGSRSVDLQTGVESRLFSGAQERQRATANTALVWNVLDFGVSYVRAQEQAAQVLIAHERERKVMQNIAQDVRQAFWRAYGAQKALPRLDALMARVRQAIARTQRMEQERMLPPLQALAYQRSLLDLQQQIVARRQDLVLARTELVSLISLKPGTELVLDAGDEEKLAAQMRPLADFDALDQAALDSRPELREEDYRRQLTVLEARKALFSMLPGIEFNLSGSYDSNKYLLHNSWADAGGMVSLQLLRVFSYPAAKRVQKAQGEVDDARRIALAMAVLTQVRIAALRYQEAQADYDISWQGADVDARIEQHMRSANRASAESEMELLRTEVKAALSEMQRYASLAALQAAYARVANSVGIDLPTGQTDLKAYATQLAQADAHWRDTSFQAGPALARRTVHVATIAPVVDGARQLDLGMLVRANLRLSGVQVISDPRQAAKLQVPEVTATFTVAPAEAGMRAVETVWTVRRGDTVLATIPYRSVISDSVGNAWTIFGDAAAASVAAKIGSLLQAEPPASTPKKQ